MEVISVKHKADIIKGECPFFDVVKNEVLTLLHFCNPISKDHTNVKASIHTEWYWEPNNIIFKNLQHHIMSEVEKYYKPGLCADGSRRYLEPDTFWCNVYKKGDHAISHDHRIHDFAFAYFVKSKWYSSPLIFTDSGKKIRPKEGTFVAFPGFLSHYVPKQRYDDTRITLSGNFRIKR